MTQNRARAKGSTSNTITIEAGPGEDPKHLRARSVLRPSVRAAVTAASFSPLFGELNLNALIAELATQAKSASDGNLQQAEEMLVAQAHSLEAIFHELARRSALNMREYVGAAETFMRLALKAQSQCRATIETLTLMKNPQPFTFVRQANVAHGPQQVNNVPQPAAEQTSHARVSENPPNELLEQRDDERLDFGTAQATVGADPALATVGEVHGAENAGR